ncbi:hypothetical protein LVJ94_01530 [Pendulispora rubella]|uniref:Uncharacterized protein n=1 Tax=Pendulispora rubella TaxID=2741070 RepID=A0ABZ2L595_9BACT
MAAPPTESDFEAHPLACSLPWEQSCVWNPCFTKQMACNSDCSKTCGSCEGTCANTCSSCKSSCAAGAAGDACRRACASTTGSCRQACLARRDKCATAECIGAAEVCEKDEKVKWKKNGCWGICPKLQACWAPCFDESKPHTAKESKACADACNRRFPKCDTVYCSNSFTGPGE